jgi:hypothetical protein
MTLDELRELCLSLPGTTEKETWGDEEHAGDITFRVRDKIYLITGQSAEGATIRTSAEQQADLISAFPEAFSMAPYVGRFGWVSVTFNAVAPDLLREVIVSAWRRTAPKAVVRLFDEGAP